jgi:NADPH:quinone reductase-like Zn-dependent oxidoreductase
MSENQSANRVITSLGIERQGQAYFFRYEEAPPAPQQFRIDTLYSGFSAGTELTFLRGTNPYLYARWDEDYGLFQEDGAGIHFPLPFLGYMEVGRVIQSRAVSVPEGQLVAMAYGHKSGHTADVQSEFFVPLPAGFDPLLGIYVAQMGPICVNGLLHAAAELVGPDVRSLGDGVRGRNVVIFGAGVIGLLTALLAREHGAAEVVIVNSEGPRLTAARNLGLTVLDQHAEPAPWLICKERWRHGPRDRGADLVFQTKPACDSLNAALRCLRPRGTVIDLAFYQGGAPELCLGAEFHHNGLTIRCAQINNLPFGLEHTWTRHRLAAETIRLLQSKGGDLRQHIITNIVPFEEAPAFVSMLATEYQPAVIQAVFAMPAADAATTGAERSGAERKAVAVGPNGTD